MADIAGIRACTAEKESRRKRKKLSALPAALLPGGVSAPIGEIRVCGKSCSKRRIVYLLYYGF